MATQELSTARQRHLYDLVEAYHAVFYYAAEFSAFADAGLKGWWRAYFATRAAAFGVVPPEVVTAAFFNFAPRMVSRAIPSAWDTIPPSRLLDMRLQVAAGALDRVLLPDPVPVEEASELALESVANLELAGRPVYAAHSSIPVPGTPQVALWHACTLLREYRFDGHNAALMSHGIGGCASHVMMVAWGRGNMATILPLRGFTEDEWLAAAAELRDRGWLDRDDRFTAEGAAARAAVEDMTDRLSYPPLRAIGRVRSERLIELLEPLLERVRRLGPVPVGWPPPHLVRESGSSP